MGAPQPADLIGGDMRVGAAGGGTFPDIAFGALRARLALGRDGAVATGKIGRAHV